MIDRLAERRQLVVRKMPPRYPVDFALCDQQENVVGWAEVKCRTNPAQKYPTYMLSLAKYEGLVRLQLFTGLPAELVVAWTDFVGTLKVPALVRIGFGGRTDRGDDQDTEPVVLIPIRQFQMIRRTQ